MIWSDIDWAVLDRLRDGFLSATPDAGPYWRSREDLANYDSTYGERIGWKWDQVLRELKLWRWRPRSRAILDWGCGSGVASRRVISFFGADTFDSLTLWDHSPLACDFAAEAAQASLPGLRVAQATPGFLAGAPRIGLLVVSHVLNELSGEARDSLRLLAAQAEAVLWVEPGTHDVSRQLGGLREQLRGSGLRVVAPCTHEHECPMFAIGRERDWCHFFAPPPAPIFADSNWVKFGQRAGIDLRSLPYAFLALDRTQIPAGSPVSKHDRLAAETVGPDSDRALMTSPGLPTGDSPQDDVSASADGDADFSRVIGRVEHFKPFARLLNCDATGLDELELPKRAAPALYKQLERTKAPLIYRWRRAGKKILGGEPLE